MHTSLQGEQEICITAILKNQELNNKELNIMYLNWTNKRSKDIECTIVLKKKQMF